MFMVCAWLKDKGGDMISHSCRSAMLHYRSSLLIMLKTLVQAPFLILGGHEEKQTLTLELFSDYEEDQVSTYLYYFYYHLYNSCKLH